jgi:NADH-quinone oxidoreductase subunit J
VICFSIAGHYLLLNSQFLAIVHIIVYSSDYDFVLFTIMLMNLNEEKKFNLELHRLGAIVSLFDLYCFFDFINSKPIVGE